MPHPDDPDILARITEATRKGHPMHTAAQLAGIGGSTGQQWYRLGQAEIEAGEQGSHVAFAEAVNQALAEMVDAKLGVIDSAMAGPKGWLPAFTLLERRMPQDFGRFQRIEVEQRTVTVSLTAQLPPESLKALLDMAQAEQAIEQPMPTPETQQLGPPAESGEAPRTAHTD